jgi:RNA polymerase sigma factor (sigma-70 family)
MEKDRPWGTLGMATRRLSVVVEHLRRLAPKGETNSLSDPELLRRFVREGDQDAFQTLVGRYGPMVLGVCRRVLYQAEDVEDAFQATFLVLVRKAASIGRQGSLKSWLYGVAYRTAAHAKVDAARRRAREVHAAAHGPADPLADLTARELLAVLDEELARLPAQYQGPLLLCYLEGKTRDEAAVELGWSLATLGRRLERGRELLRNRLTRRGLALPAVLVPVLLQAEATAAVPVALTISTITAAAQVAAGRAAAAVVSARTAALVRGVLRTMTLTKLKAVLTILLGIGVLAAGAAGLARPQLRPAQGPFAPQAADKEKPAKSDQENLRGTWAGVSGEAGGNTLPADAVKNYRLVFGDGKLTVKFAGEGKEGTFKLDPAAKPKTIDLTLDGGTGVGIYSLDGDTLKLCFTETGKEDRPTEFATKKGRWAVLLVFKRQSADKPAAGAKEAAGKRAALPDVAALQEQVKALKEQVKLLEATNGRLKTAIRRAREEITGVLTKVDIEKNTISFTLRGTKLALEAIPLSNDVTFFVGEKEASINEVKKGMQVSLELRTDDGKSVVSRVKARKEGKK